MKNYEIVLMFSVGEDALTDQTIDKYKSVITENGGNIDRYEDWGSLKMAYDINIARFRLPFCPFEILFLFLSRSRPPSLFSSSY